MLHFQQISDVIGIPMEELRQINPQYLHENHSGTKDLYPQTSAQLHDAIVNNEESIYSAIHFQRRGYQKG